MLITLARLPLDARGVLHAVSGPRAYRRRLLELGFVPGTPLRLVRRVGIGDVLEVELRGSRVSLRISEAEAVLLQADAGACGTAAGACTSCCVAAPSPPVAGAAPAPAAAAAPGAARP